ncbi:unnamed protein product, partial [marine sediment metagenome]
MAIVAAVITFASQKQASKRARKGRALKREEA